MIAHVSPFRRARALAAAALTLTLLPAAAHADRIELTDGRVLEGTVARRSDADKTVTLNLASGEVTLPADQIRRVAPSSPAEKRLFAARDALRTKDYPQAATALADALDQDASTTEAAALLVTHGRALAENLAAVPPTDRKRLSAALDRLPTTAGGDLTFVRLWLRLALGENDKIGPVFDRLGTDWLDAHQDARTALAGWLIKTIDADINASHFDLADTHLAALARIDPPLAKAQTVQFLLQWGRRLREDHQLVAALDLYARRLRPVAPQIAAEYIRRTLDEADHLYAQSDDASAHDKLVAVWRDYGVPLLGDPARQRLVQIWHNAGWRALRADRFDEARTAFTHENAVIPGSGDTDLAQIDFRQRKQKLAKDDLIGAYELGVWANNHRLDDDALECFRLASTSPIVGANARAYIGQIMNRKAETDLTHLLDLYDQGRYQDVINGILQFQQAGYASGYQKQAANLQKLTMNALEVTLSEKPQQAQALYQQAERAFYQDHLKETSEKLETIFEHYKDTLIYPQARNLYARVHERQALARLEVGNDAPPPMADDVATSPTPKQTEMSGEIRDIYQQLERTHRPQPTPQPDPSPS